MYGLTLLKEVNHAYFNLGQTKDFVLCILVECVEGRGRAARAPSVARNGRLATSQPGLPTALIEARIPSIPTYTSRFPAALVPLLFAAYYRLPTMHKTLYLLFIPERVPLRLSNFVKWEVT